MLGRGKGDAGSGTKLTEILMETGKRSPKAPKPPGGVAGAEAGLALVATTGAGQEWGEAPLVQGALH